MEEFGDWIYILLLVVAGIASLISSMRKKTQQAAEQKQPPEISINQEEDVDDPWIPIRETKPVSKPQFKRQAHQSDPKIDNKSKQFHSSIFQEGQPALQPEEIASIENEEEFSPLTIDLIPEEADEWRKAFIYNEIFSRKN